MWGIKPINLCLKKVFIQNAIQVLADLNISYEGYEISVVHIDNKLIQVMDPTLNDRYAVLFFYKQPSGLGAITAISIDKKTNRLLTVIAKSDMYEIPEALQ